MPSTSTTWAPPPEMWATTTHDRRLRAPEAGGMPAVTGRDALLERDDALARLLRAAHEALCGEGRLVLVSGEAGIGKSRLVQAFLDRRRDDPPARVLRGACDDLITPRPLGPFHDLAGDAPPDLRAALAGGTPDDVHDALLTLLAAPTVLVVEDVHWADDATVDALALLARRLEGTPVLVVVTYRDDEVPPDAAVQRLLGAIRAPTGVRVALEPLSARAVGVLAGDTGAGLRVHASTRGNPFLVAEVLAARHEGLPASVRDAVLARTASLGPASRALLELLAVVPNRLETDLLDRLHPGWPAAAEPAERRGILELRDGGLAFRHELARLAVAHALPGARRLALGRAMLAALVDQHPVDEARILHYAVSCQDAEAIAAHGPAAARQAARAGAHQQALGHHAQLEPHAHMLAPAERAAVAEEHGWELYNALRFREAVERSRAAVELRRELGDPVARGRAQVALAWHLYLAADVPGAVAEIDDAVDVLVAGGDTEAVALARSYRGFLWILADREEDGLAELDVATALGAHGLDAVRTCYRGLARAFLGDPGGPDLLEQGVAGAAAAEQREFVALGYTALVKAWRRLGDDDRVRRCAEAGLARTRASELRSHGFTLEAHLCQLLAQQGRWDEAEEGLRRLVAVTPDAGILARETLPHLGRLLVRRGSPEADHLLDRAWALAERTDILPVLVPAGIALIERAWLAGDPEPERWRAELLLRRTDRPGAERARGELLRYVRRCGWSVPAFPGARPEHRLGLEGDWRGAAAAWERVGDPYERALELAGSGQPGPTLDALELLDALGAVPAVAWVRALLRDLGVSRIPRGPRPETRAHPAGLTTRQVDVLEMLGEGLTNGEIAARLVVSTRTVDHHVSAVLAKLGVSRRRDAVAAARQLD